MKMAISTIEFAAVGGALAVVGAPALAAGAAAYAVANLVSDVSFANVSELISYLETPENQSTIAEYYSDAESAYNDALSEVTGGSTVLIDGGFRFFPDIVYDASSCRLHGYVIPNYQIDGNPALFYGYLQRDSYNSLRYSVHSAARTGYLQM